jgi:hypothetical protein
MASLRWLCTVLAVLFLPLEVAGLREATAEVYWIEAPEFAPPWTGYIPELGDLDGDDDHDLIYARVLHSYRNVGSPALPSWGQDDSLVVGVSHVSGMTTCLADLDDDGDLNLSVGQTYGEVWSVLYYRNTGSSTQPVWQNDNSIYEGVYGSETHPELADLDDDGDLDLVVSITSDLRAYRNTVTPEAPIWTREDSLLSGMSLLYGLADQNFADVDADGDLDAVIGSKYFGGPIMCFENAGTPQAPVWVENESMLVGVERDIAGLGLDLADLDGDGDPDLLVKEAEAEPVVYLNVGPITLVEPEVSWSAIKAMFR